MDDRVRTILSQVRLNLKQVSISNLADGEIYGKAQLVQNEILLKTKCIEKSFKIVFKKNKEDYDCLFSGIRNISNIYTSWNGKIKIDSVREDYLNRSISGEACPYYVNFFAERAWFRPIPQRDTDYVIIDGKQITIIHKMDKDIPPEIPSYADGCLIDGICSKYDMKTFLPIYIAKLDLISGEKNNQLSHKKQKQSNW